MSVRPRLIAKLSRRAVVTAAAVAVVVIVGAAAAVTSRPSSCASCHAMRPYAQALADSSHSQIGCYSCHLEAGVWSYPAFKAREWGPMALGSLLGREPTGTALGVASRPCLSCHEAVLEGPVRRNGIRIDHLACAGESMDCSSCHNAVAHGRAIRWVRAPVMEECVRCHVSAKAPTGCDSCHEGRRERDRLQKGPWQVTHGASWKSTHGLGDIRFCVTCHPADYCVKCHGVELPHGSDFGRLHGAVAKTTDAKCVDCHDREALCDECHRMQMPHPKGFLKVHAEAVSDRGEKTCARCHIIKLDCRGCHDAHVHPATTEGTLGGPGGLIGVPNPGGVR